MSDAHLSAFGRGRRPKEGWEAKGSEQSQKNLDNWLERGYTTVVKNKIQEISKVDEDLGRILSRALDMAKRGVWPFQAIPLKKDENKISQDIKTSYPDIYEHLIWQYNEFFEQKIKEISETDRIAEDIKKALAFARRGVKPFDFVLLQSEREETVKTIKSRHPTIYRYLLKQYELNS